MNIEDIAARLQTDQNGHEVRSFSAPTEVREDEGIGTLFGHAAVFDQETNIGGFFREKIAPGAFEKTIKEADVRHLFNHDSNYVLARTTNKTLTLREDDEGLAYDAILNPDDPDAVRVAAKVKRGDVTQSSFAFQIVKQEWVEPEADSRDLPLRIVKEARLFDTSSVTYPAYAGAETGIRSLANDILLDQFGWTDDVRNDVMRHLLTGSRLSPALKDDLTRASTFFDELRVQCDDGGCEVSIGTSSHTNSNDITLSGSTGTGIVIDPPAIIVEEQPAAEIVMTNNELLDEFARKAFATGLKL